MNKKSVFGMLALVLLTGGVFASQKLVQLNQDNRSSATEGQQCTGDNGCPASEYCQKTSNQQVGQCTTDKKMTSVCTRDAECEGGLNGVCKDNACIQKGWCRHYTSGKVFKNGGYICFDNTEHRCDNTGTDWEKMTETKNCGEAGCPVNGWGRCNSTSVTKDCSYPGGILKPGQSACFEGKNLFTCKNPNNNGAISAIACVCNNGASSCSVSTTKYKRTSATCQSNNKYVCVEDNSIGTYTSLSSCESSCTYTPSKIVTCNNKWPGSVCMPSNECTSRGGTVNGTSDDCKNDVACCQQKNTCQHLTCSGGKAYGTTKCVSNKVSICGCNGVWSVTTNCATGFVCDSTGTRCVGKPAISPTPKPSTCVSKFGSSSICRRPDDCSRISGTIKGTADNCNGTASTFCCSK
jgi:hypothetical protein